MPFITNLMDEYTQSLLIYMNWVGKKKALFPFPEKGLFRLIKALEE